MAIDYRCTFEVSGKVLEIGEVQTFASGFSKRNIIVEASKDTEKFSNPIQLTLKKEDCARADTLGVGDGVEVTGYVEGRRWEKDGNVRHFIDLSVKSIMVTDKAAKPTTAANWKELLALGAAYGEDKDAVIAYCMASGKPFKEMQSADWQKIAADIVAAHSGDAGTASEDFPGEEEMPF